jgi:hypothetical protein
VPGIGTRVSQMGLLPSGRKCAGAASWSVMPSTVRLAPVPSNLSTIGFAVHDMDAFAHLAAMAAERGERLDARHVRWEAGGGAELWVALDRRGRICAMEPHFASATVVPVAVTAVLARDDCTATVHAEWGVQAIAVDIVAPALLGGVALPARADLQAVVFAHEIGRAAGEAAFVCEAPVRDAAWRVNAVTGRRFAWMLLGAQGGELEMVADPDLLGELPAAGTVLRVAGRVAGRLRDVRELPGRRRRRRL